MIREGFDNDLKYFDKYFSKEKEIDNVPTKDHFEFLSNENSFNSDLGLFSFLPDAQGVDYEEKQFAKRMKKKKRRLQ